MAAHGSSSDQPSANAAAPPRVAAAQFVSEPGTVEANLDRAVAAVTEAADRGARLVVLPECCLSGYDLDWFRAGAPGGGEALAGECLQALAEISRARGIALVVNDLERAGATLYSTSVVIDGDSERARHRKSHVTEAEEAAGLAAGTAVATPVALPGLGLAVGPLICFEHGFPEIALRLALDGAGLLAMSSAIRRGSEHLRDLRIRARAQDNGCYAVAANAVGRGFCGTSVVADPHGEVVASASAVDAEVIVADIDPGLVDVARRAEPVLRRRRPDLYGPRAERMQQ
jgi:predicted amidohydrolase